MSKGLLIFGLAAAGLIFIVVIFKLLKKGAKFAAKLPTNFLIFFLIFGVLGLSGFMARPGYTEYPVMIGSLLILASLIGGIILTDKLFGKWEWSMAAGFWKKLLYLTGISLVSIIAFLLVFLLCEHGGLPRGNLKNDLAWWFGGLIFTIVLPLLVKHVHLLWNNIPKISQVKPIFQLVVGVDPPFIETGGVTINFQFTIPVDYRSKELIKSRVAVPVNKTLQEAFHYKIHEHNIVKRFAKKIIYAEDNKRSKVYGWSFFRIRKIWWGLGEQAAISGSCHEGRRRSRQRR
jgi:hypothetical protein